VYAKFRCAVLHIKKALGIFRELIPRTTRVAFGDLPYGSKNSVFLILAPPTNIQRALQHFPSTSYLQNAEQPVIVCS